jgi:hypothetical protein
VSGWDAQFLQPGFTCMLNWLGARRQLSSNSLAAALGKG